MRSLMLAVAAGALIASPALAKSSKTAPATTPAAAPANAAPAASAPKTKSKGTSKMAACAAQWKALGDKGQQAYKDKAKGMKSKKGNALSGYNVWTGECMKKA